MNGSAGHAETQKWGLKIMIRNENERKAMADMHIRICLSAYMMKYGKMQHHILDELGISRPTLMKHLQDPDNMTLGEFRQIVKMAEMRPRDILECVIGREDPYAKSVPDSE